VGGPGKPPFWRTLEEFCEELGSVSLKSKHSTHTGLSWEVGCGGEADRTLLYMCALIMYVSS
jgi:hypothetical protein